MTTVGTIELIASIDTSRYTKGAKTIDDTNKDIEGSSDRTSKRISDGFSTAAKVGLAAIATAAVAVGAAVVSNFDRAIKRVDTLNNSTRTFENLGFGAKQIDSAMKALDKSISGLPTSLDEAVRGVQLLAGSTGDIGRAQKIFSAINNAVIGFGGNSQQVDGAIRQLSQDISGGTLQAETWNSLLDNGLGPTLNAIAKQMGLTSKELKSGLSTGAISVEEFTNRLIELNEKGGGGMQSLDKIARDATSGISTGWQNLQTAITRGLASIIQAIGSENISGAITNLGKAFETVLKAVSTSINFLIQYKDVIGQIATVITVLLIPAMLRMIVVQTLAGLNALRAGAQMATGWLLALGPIGLIVAAVGAAVALIIMNWDSVKNFVLGAWEAIKNGVSSALNWIRDNWQNIFMFITGPVGLAVGLIIKNFDKIRDAASTVFNWIRNIFSTIGDIASGVFKGAINGVLGYVERTINGFIRLINGALGAINKIPGVNISRIGEINIPRLANGGIVPATRGGVLANIAEGGEAEAVIPLSKLDKMMNNDNTTNNAKIEINIQGVFATSPNEQRRVAEQIAQRLREIQQSKGIMGVMT